MKSVYQWTTANHLLSKLGTRIIIVIKIRFLLILITILLHLDALNNKWLAVPHRYNEQYPTRIYTLN